MHAVVAIACCLALGTSLGASPAGPTPAPLLSGLSFPTNLAFLPDGRLLFTEKETGALRVVEDGALLPTPAAIFEVDGQAERGLLGVAVGPSFEDDPWVYVSYSDAATGRNVIERLRLEGSSGGRTERLLVGLESAAGYHNGGDLVFGVDGMLYATLGEAHDPSRAQDPEDLGGKVVRLAPDGSVPGDNPFGADNPVWSIGHRNSFGLCVDPDEGTLWSTENGPERDDEINRIEAGGNYGWPAVTGPHDAGADGDDVFIDPLAVFPVPVALTGCAVVDGEIYAGAFNTGTVVRIGTAGPEAGESSEFALFDAGVTDVALGPDGRLYIATSEAIWTVPIAASSPVAPSSSGPPGGAGNSPAPPAADQGGAPPWVPLAAAVVLGAGLIARLVAGRRIRGTDD